MTTTIADGRGLNVLALVTDGFGGHGGIARYNRDLLTALSVLPGLGSVTVVPRSDAGVVPSLPPKLSQVPARAGRLDYMWHAFAAARALDRIDVLFCGHLFLAPFAAWLARRRNARLWLQLHGFEAWRDPGRGARSSAGNADLITSVSRITRHHFLGWCPVDPARVRVLPNTFDAKFAPQPRSQVLAARYGLQGLLVLLTVGRIAASERYKGHDRVIAAMPQILQGRPDTAYLIVGDGDDRPRLEALAKARNVAHRVVFAGRVDDEALAEHYSLADAFIMPSTGEGFGIVFLEAAAMGLPVIAGNADGSVDALADGRIGRLVDPQSVEQIAGAVFAVLDGQPGQRTGRLSQAALSTRFATANFRAHVAGLLGDLAEERPV